MADIRCSSPLSPSVSSRSSSSSRTSSSSSLSLESDLLLDSDRQSVSSLEESDESDGDGDMPGLLPAEGSEESFQPSTNSALTMAEQLPTRPSPTLLSQSPEIYIWKSPVSGHTTMTEVRTSGWHYDTIIYGTSPPFTLTVLGMRDPFSRSIHLSQVELSPLNTEASHQISNSRIWPPTRPNAVVTDASRGKGSAAGANNSGRD